MSQILSQVYGNQIISVVKQCPATPNPALPYRFYLTPNGDGDGGTFNFNGDYSVTPLTLYFEAQYRFEVYSLIINISDASKFTQDGYGGISGGVTNGIKFYVRPPGVPVDIPLLYEPGVKHNYQWLEITPDSQLTQWDGTAQTLAVHLDVINLFGIPLDVAAGGIFKVVLNDNFTGLTNHSFRLSGKYYVNG